jgi:hypothetical protein
MPLGKKGKKTQGEATRLEAQTAKIIGVAHCTGGYVQRGADN